MPIGIRPGKATPFESMKRVPTGCGWRCPIVSDSTAAALPTRSGGSSLLTIMTHRSGTVAKGAWSCVLSDMVQPQLTIVEMPGVGGRMSGAAKHVGDEREPLPAFAGRRLSPSHPISGPWRVHLLQCPDAATQLRGAQAKIPCG